jgi:hypothetical protein
VCNAQVLSEFDAHATGGRGDPPGDDGDEGDDGDDDDGGAGGPVWAAPYGVGAGSRARAGRQRGNQLGLALVRCLPCALCVVVVSVPGAGRALRPSGRLIEAPWLANSGHDASITQRALQGRQPGAVLGPRLTEFGDSAGSSRARRRGRGRGGGGAAAEAAASRHAVDAMRSRG